MAVRVWWRFNLLKSPSPPPPAALDAIAAAAVTATTYNTQILCLTDATVRHLAPTDLEHCHLPTNPSGSQQDPDPDKKK